VEVSAVVAGEPERSAMKKNVLGLIAIAALAGAGAARAGGVQWSIGINLPPVAIVGGNAPVYAPAPPVVYAPPPVVYAPPVPVYVQPAPVVYAAPRVVYAPAPVVYGPPRVVGRPVPMVVEGWVPHERRGRKRSHWHDWD
jgi:hypothetical protein